MNIRRWLAALACALLACCAYVDATTTPYIGVPRFPAGDPATVQVLQSEPMRTHDRLGYEDGLADAKGERERYAASCSNDFNADQYQRGFQDGYSRRPKPAGETKVQ